MKFHRWTLVIILILGLVISQRSLSQTAARSTTKTFTFGSTNIVTEKDPVLVQDAVEFGILDAVIEPLFAVDYTTEGIPIVNCLATDSRWHNTTSFEIDLRENVLFHDGTPFNATVAKWNLDRIIYWLVDSEGVINNTEVVSDYRIRINLNFPYALIKNKLATNRMGMLSMHSHADNWDVEISLTDPLVGTGPFKFISHSETTSQTKFAQNPTYWRGAPEIEEMTFLYYENSDGLNNALLSGEVDYTVEVYEENRVNIENNPSLTILPGIPEIYMHMISLNTQRINQTMRNAITYAVNYSYILSDALEGEAIRQTGPIPEGKQYYNPEIPYADMNLSRARQILIDGGVASSALNLTDDAPWIVIAHSATPLAEYIFPIPETLNWLGVTLNLNLAKIGVKLNYYTLPWYEYYPDQQLYNLTENDLLYEDWLWENVDPTQELIDQYAIGQETNFGLLNDDLIDEWVHLQLIETDETMKQDRFDNITYRLQQELFPCLYLWQNVIHSVLQTSRWTNITLNAYNAYNFYPAHWVGTERNNIPGYPMEFIIIAVFIAEIYPIQKKFLHKR